MIAEAVLDSAAQSFENLTTKLENYLRLDFAKIIVAVELISV